jgi:hypothetical protein
MDLMSIALAFYFTAFSSILLSKHCVARNRAHMVGVWTCLFSGLFPMTGDRQMETGSVNRKEVL